MVMTLVAQPVTANVGTGTGVPKLWSTVISDAEAVASVELDTFLQSYLVSNAATQWGLFNTYSQPVLTAARVRAIDIRSQYRKSDAPQENGGFMSYNKVKLPRQVMLEVLCDGSAMSYGNVSAISSLLSVAGITGATQGVTVRKQFLTALESLVADLNTYLVVTPEATYSDMNVIGYAIRRETHRGVTMVWAEIMLEEVRLQHSKSVSVSQSAQPSGASQTNSGNVQSQDLTSAQTDTYASGTTTS
ncbi:hypothetical protein [Komagataeibacter intermedius]|uniref:Uncharacterized protein n=2 Tax=Komagataeibacter intermedius TaxID=66229 RepID=A0ABQ0PJI6_9PROT|nr:hypothetical protein [Komagataeibacter intermedius]GAN86339.1 hypothetical protein Gain_0027_014 [Komagataeibacter intermedius TF2]GBQ67892.1 hypothetical protein AA0521_1097 [Komagataeibacter intermedius NRIC 0521]